MSNLNYCYDRKIESAYIITLKNNSNSERMAQRCKESCDRLDIPSKFWYAYDGTGAEITEPEHLENAGHMKWFKCVDSELSKSEVACALSHISLWCHCIEIDRPIIILEHDAIMLERISEHPVFNSILYLGCKEQYEKKYPVSMIPPYGSVGRNYYFTWRAHAYIIDPQVAKNMVALVLKNGIFEALDIMIRADMFSILQLGLYAYDESETINTTITNRKQTLAGFKKS